MTFINRTLIPRYIKCPRTRGGRLLKIIHTDHITKYFKLSESLGVAQKTNFSVIWCTRDREYYFS